MAGKKVYAVLRGIQPGVYYTWPEAQAQVKGYPGARFKGFASEEEASRWLQDGETQGDAPRKKKPPRPTALPHPPPQPGEIVVYTDGGALGNPGPGGYGVVIETIEGREELSSGYRLTTNNRMELTACIAALRRLAGRSERIILHSDSSYVVNGIARGWARGWRARGWRKSDGEPALNRDLWEELLELSEALDVHFRWVKGHAGNPLNERCDKLAQTAARGVDLQVDHGYQTG